MLFNVLERYCKEKLHCSAVEFIGVSVPTYYLHKRNNVLPLKHCKTVCQKLGCPWTDNPKELTLFIVERYYNV